MRQLGHDYLDVLKVDIEGTEWGVFPGTMGRAAIGQIQVDPPGASAVDRGPRGPLRDPRGRRVPRHFHEP